jgi:radical SAM protein with 4Fe4S-binding SPASM domain
MYLLDQIAAAGTFQVQLTGGEIGIRGLDLIPILEKTAELGLAVLFSTNGVWNCIDKKDEFLTELARFNNIIQSKISIEGTPEFHDSVRGEGTYAAAVETLAKLSQAGLNPRISTTIFAESCNSRQLRHLTSLAKTYRAGFQPIPMRPVGRAKSLTLRPPTTEQLAEYTKELTEVRAAERQPISFNFDIIHPTHNVPVFDVHHSASCGASLWGVHITHRGEVYPCGFAQEINSGVTFLSGQVTQEVSLLDIWLNSQPLASVRDAGKSEKCQTCGHYGQGCWGGCWVMGWHATGAVNGMDGYCFVDSLMPA